MIEEKMNCLGREEGGQHWWVDPPGSSRGLMSYVDPCRWASISPIVGLQAFWAIHGFLAIVPINHHYLITLCLTG